MRYPVRIWIAAPHRGIAQLVEQRSPKPRAVSSRLTTPATNAQVLRSLCVLFLRCFCVLELAPLRSANIRGILILYLQFRQGCGPAGSAFSRKGSFRGAILFIYSTCYGRGRSGKQHFGTCHSWGCRTPFVNLQREGSLSEGAGTAQAVTEGVSSHFFRFLKYMLDKCGVFRYNKARSGGKRRAKLERSWPGSSVG